MLGVGKGDERRVAGINRTWGNARLEDANANAVLWRPGDLAAAVGFRLYPLKGVRVGQWSVRISGSCRVVFRFEDGKAVDVDLITDRMEC